MTDQRPLSERFDLRYIRQRHGADRAIIPLSFLAVVAVGCTVAFNSMRRDDRMYSSGELTIAHDMFAADCARCHQQDPDRMNYWLPARDHACMACHDAATHSHHGSAHPGGEMSFLDDEHPLAKDCATCHVEHQGRGFDLARVPDSQCTLCHSDLDVAGRHPAGIELSRPVHARVNSFAADHPEWHVLSASLEDPGTLRLNHKLHVIDEGLDCSACHTIDSTGRYIEPISFDAHCRSCHEADLGVIDPASSLVAPVPSPHGSLSVLRQTIGDRFAIAAAMYGATPEAERAPSEEGSGSSRRRRGRRGGETEPSGSSIPEFSDRAALESWIEEQTLSTLSRLDISCSKCHTTERTGIGFDVKPVNIKSVWLDRAVFSHGAHIMVRCDQCHPGGSSSSATSDVLLPGIASCQTCHTPEVGAPSDCVTCHTYHDHSSGWKPGDRLMRDLLSVR